MKKKIVWLGVSWLVVAALVLASCGPGVPEGEEEEEEEEEEVPTLSIGETYQTAEIEVTVSEATITDSYEYYDETSESMATEEADPGISFLIASVEMKNVGNTVRIMEGSDVFRAVDAEGLSKTVMPYLGEDPLVRIHHLQPGTKIEGKILFEIPKGASGLKIKYLTIWLAPLAEWEIE